MSTVTSLFTNGSPNEKLSKATRVKSKTVPVGTFNEEVYFSSTKLLRKYIQDYEKEQTVGLAKSLTSNQRNAEPIRSRRKGNQQSSINNEIQLAKTLLPSEYMETKADGIDSMTTDELLASDPCVGLQSDRTITSSCNYSKPMSKACSNRWPAKKSSCTSNTTEHKENTCSMHFSDLSETQSKISKASSYSDNSFNKYCLNGISYTPHSVKYRSILSDSTRFNRRKKVLSDSGDGDSSIYQKHFRNSRNASHFAPDQTNDEDLRTATTSFYAMGDHQGLIESKTLTDQAGRTPYHPTRRKTYDDDILDGDRPWELPLKKTLFKSSTESMDSQSHFSVSFHLDDKESRIRGFMEECLGEVKSDGYAEADLQNEDHLSSGHPGPVEKLKNMLFTLQSLSPHPSSNTPTSQESQDSEKVEEGMTEGQVSFRKAMSHLSNLKSLLQSTKDT